MVHNAASISLTCDLIYNLFAFLKKLMKFKAKPLKYIPVEFSCQMPYNSTTFDYLSNEQSTQTGGRQN